MHLDSQAATAFISFVQKFIQIDSSEIKAFFSKASRRLFKKGEFFIKEGEVCHHLLFIQQGIFRYFILHNGIDFTKDFAVDDENPLCTAFTSFKTKEPSQIWIEALEDSVVWVWNEQEVSFFFENHPLWMQFEKKLVEALYFRKEKREVSLLKHSPQERYQQFLADFPQLNQRVPQYLIAGYLGLTPESLSRIRRRLTHRS